MIRSCALIVHALLVLALPCLDAEVVLSTRFESVLGPLPAHTSSPGAEVEVSVSPGFGTVDGYRGARSGAVKVTARFPVKKPDTTRVDSGKNWFEVSPVDSPLARDVRRLGSSFDDMLLGFDLWVSEAVPLQLFVDLVNERGSVIATASSTFFPPVAGAFYRHTRDLGDFALEAGVLDPTAIALRFRFAVGRETGRSMPSRLEVRIDNLSCSDTSYYVHPDGDDTNDGRDPRTAFASIQRAVEQARAGDVISVQDGTYVAERGNVLAEIDKAGAPDAWIVLRARRGHHPVLRGRGWRVVSLTHKAAYVEVRGLDVHGFSREIAVSDALVDGAIRERDGKPYVGDPIFNTDGIALDGRQGTEAGGKPHHIRFIGNTVREMPGGGILAIAADHVTVEGNRVRENCHQMRYAASGISVFRAWDFDDDRGHKYFVLANHAHGNRCHVPWSDAGRISDGNGIIVDDFINYQPGASKVPYEGRTLVQNNVTFNNGGSGIHAYAANHVDIVNNTAYHNVQSPELQWRQIFAGGRCRDVRIVNNILWAQRGKPIRTSTGNSTDIRYEHNLMFGDGENRVGEGGGLGTSSEAGQAEVVVLIDANPQWRAPALDPKVADFRLRADSPAIDAGSSSAVGVPLTDITGRRRPVGAGVDLGAYEFAGK